MTYLSFDNYVSKARENLDGTVRIARGDQTNTELINNKGGFGHSVATFFKNVGSLFGWKDDSRIQRNKDALDGFKQALTTQFGATIAQKVWDDRKLDEVGKLTGKQIIELSDYAKSLRRENGRTNDRMLKDCLPIDYHDKAYPGGKFFAEICRNVGYDLDVARTLTPERYDAYYDRLMTAFNERTQFDDVALTPEQTREIAEDVLRQVVKLDLGGRLDEAQRARQAFVDSVQTLMTDIAGGRSPRRLLESLVAMNKCMDEVARHEGTVGGDNFGEVKNELLREAMLQINTLDPKLLGKGREKIFGDDSSLRALYGELNRFSQEEQLSQYGIGHVNNLMNGVGELVQMLSKSIGSRTESHEHDFRLLDDQTGLGRSTKTRARESVGTYFQGLQPQNLPGPRGLIDELKGHVGKFGDLDMPTWHSTEVLERLDEEVRRYAEQASVPLATACDLFQEAIDGSDLPDTLKNKLKAGLGALRSLDTFNDRLSQTDEFKGLDPQNAWRLFMNGDRSPWGLEQFNQGSLSGLYESFGHMLQTRDQPLTGKYIEDLQRVGCQNTYTVDLAMAFKPNVDEGIVEFFQENARTPQGFRDGNTNLNLDPQDVTPDGLQSLRDNQERLGYVLKEENGNVTLDFREETPEGCEERANAILGIYLGQIEIAQTDDQKLEVIGRAVQDLYRSHLFKDGNTRTVVVNLMNRMLLDNGLSPSILSDPKVAATCSLPEFVQHIKDGQQTFEMLTG
jgi:hypothetical protein